MLVWYVRQVRQRIEARWWIDGRPWEVLVAVFVAVMIHAAIVTGVAQRRASNSTGSNGSKFPASPGLVLRSSSSPSLRLVYTREGYIRGYICVCCCYCDSCLSTDVDTDAFV